MMRYTVMLSLIGMVLLMLAGPSTAYEEVIPRPTIERLGEFDAVLYGEASNARMIDIVGSDGVTRYQAVADVRIVEVFWDRNRRLPEDSVTVEWGPPVERRRDVDPTWLSERYVGRHAIWCVYESAHGVRRYRVHHVSGIPEPGSPEEMLRAYRQSAATLMPFQETTLHLEVMPGTAVAEVPVQLALWHHGADATVVPEDLPALRNFEVETDGLSRYWVEVTNVRSRAMADNESGDVLWISVRLVPCTQPLHVTEPLEIPPVQRCEVRVLMWPPGSRARLASPWVTVTVVRPDLGDLDRRLIEEISRRRLWGVIGPHEETLSDEQTEALAGLLARHPESLLAPAIRCGLAFGTTGRLVERAVELKALSADASFGWREECLLKAYALFREAGEDAEAERVAAQLAAPGRIGSRLISAPATGGAHSPDTTHGDRP